MTDFIRILGVVLPVLIIVGFGYFGKKIKLFKEEFVKEGSNLVFKVFLPANMFVSIYKASGFSIVKPQLILYSVLTLLIIIFVYGILYKKMGFDIESRATMLHAMVRGNFVLHGLAIAKNYYPQNEVAIVAIYIGIISAFTNAFAIVIHEVMSTNNEKIKTNQLLINLCKNIVLIAVVLGIVMNISGLKIYKPLLVAIEDISNVATPLGLICVGASMKFETESLEKRALNVFLFNKTMLVPIVGLTIFYLLGFKGPELFFVIILFASPVAVSSHALTCIYTSKGDFCAKLIVYTSIINSFVTFFAIYILSILGAV